MPSSSHSPFVQLLVSVAAERSSGSADACKPNATPLRSFRRLRKHFANQHAQPNVHDILCADRHTGQWLPVRLFGRVLWQSGK